jgi:glucose/mannose-6-phosphate isomerase
MQSLIEGFSGRLREGAAHYRQMPELPATPDIRHVVISAQGDACAAAELAKAFTAAQLPVPLSVLDGYRLPAFVDEHTLLVAASRSGDAEEVLDVTQQALDRRAVVTCLTGGGKLGQLAREKGCLLAGLPAPLPQEGYATADLLVGLLCLLRGYALTGDALGRQLEKAAKLIDDREEVIRGGAMDLARALVGRLPVLYADEAFYPVVLHFRRQLNRVARQLAHLNVYPALNDDELAAWEHPAPLIDQTVLVQVQTPLDHPRVMRRMNICRPLYAPKADKVVEIGVRFGDSLPEQSLYVVHLFDWAAFYLAELNGVAPGPSDVLGTLAAELARG